MLLHCLVFCASRYSLRKLEELEQCLLIQQCFYMVYECNNNYYAWKVDLSNEGIDWNPFIHVIYLNFSLHSTFQLKGFTQKGDMLFWLNLICLFFSTGSCPLHTCMKLFWHAECRKTVIFSLHFFCTDSIFWPVFFKNEAKNSEKNHRTSIPHVKASLYLKELAGSCKKDNNNNTKFHQISDLCPFCRNPFNYIISTA